MTFLSPPYEQIRLTVQAIADCQISLATAAYEMTSRDDDKRPPLIRTMIALSSLAEAICAPRILVEGSATSHSSAEGGE